MRNGAPLKALIAVAVIGTLVGIWAGLVYAKLVHFRAGVATSWGQLETAYGRRTELANELLAITKAGVRKGGSGIAALSVARDGLPSVSPGPFGVKSVYDAAQSKLGSALAQALEEAHSDPRLNGLPAFRAVRAQLIAVGNEIAQGRDRFNQSALECNVYRETPQISLIGRIARFGRAPFIGTPPSAALVRPSFY